MCYVYQIAADGFHWAGCSFCCECFGWTISNSRRREGRKRASDKGCRRSNRVERWKQAAQHRQDRWKRSLHGRWSAGRRLPGHFGSEWRSEGVYHEYENQGGPANATKFWPETGGGIASKRSYKERKTHGLGTGEHGNPYRRPLGRSSRHRQRRARRFERQERQRRSTTARTIKCDPRGTADVSVGGERDEALSSRGRLF